MPVRTHARTDRVTLYAAPTFFEWRGHKKSKTPQTNLCKGNHSQQLREFCWGELSWRYSVTQPPQSAQNLLGQTTQQENGIQTLRTDFIVPAMLLRTYQ